MKTLNIVDVFSCRPLNNYKNLTLISLNNINRYNEAKKATKSVKNLYFFSVDIQLFLS